MRFFGGVSVLRLLSAVLLVGVMCFGCGDDGGDGGGGGGPTLIVISDFEGSWMADSYRVTSAANPMITFDLIEVGGAFSFDLDDAGAFTGRGFVPASVAGMTLELPAQGVVELIDQDSIAVTFTPEILPFLNSMRAAFTLDDETFTIVNPNASFDFDGDEVAEDAILEGIMIRNDGSLPPVVFTEDFEGSWEAAVYRVTSVANPILTLELVALGATFQWDVDVSGGFTGDVFVPAAVAGEDVDLSFAGNFSLVKQDTILTVFTPEIPPFLTETYGWFALREDTLWISDQNATFDFDGDTVEEDAIFEGTMVRTSTVK